MADKDRDLLSREEVEHMEQLELLKDERLEESDGISPEESFRRMIRSSSVAKVKLLVLWANL